MCAGKMSPLSIPTGQKKEWIIKAGRLPFSSDFRDIKIDWLDNGFNFKDGEINESEETFIQGLPSG